MSKIEREYKALKKSFIDFIKWYNVTTPNVSKACKESIKTLHGIWKKASLKNSTEVFFDMKEHHTIINTELFMSKQYPDTPWNDYIKNGSGFRLNLMKANIRNDGDFFNKLALFESSD